MKKIWWETAAVIGAAFLLFLCGFVAGNLIKEPPVKSGDWPGWIQAFGSALAIFWAVWLATNETRQRTRESLDLAKVTAASMLPRILQLMIDVEAILNALDRQKQTRELIIETYECARQLGKHTLWHNSEIVPLIPLQGECAFSLAAAAPQINNAIHRFRYAKDDQGVMNDVPQFAESMIEILNGVHALLNIAFEECKKAAISVAHSD